MPLYLINLGKSDFAGLISLYAETGLCTSVKIIFLEACSWVPLQSALVGRFFMDLAYFDIHLPLNFRFVICTLFTYILQPDLVSE
jgi:hypothetical protein